jgi:hypothetical protein
MYILENDSKMRSSSSSDLQNIFEKFMEKFNITGIGVYSIIKDLMSENIVEINNNELNNESIIKIKKTN